MSAWLSAYAKPGQVRGALYEDPPLFSSEVNTSIGGSIRQGLGPLFALFNKYLGDQWSVNNWDGMRAAAATELPPWIAFLVEDGPFAGNGGPPQNLKEYDPEWGRAFWTGTVAASCDHERMLSSVKVPVLLTHHFRMIDEQTGGVRGAMSDVQAHTRARAGHRGGTTGRLRLAADDGPHAARAGPDPVREGVDGVGGEAEVTFWLPRATSAASNARATVDG